MPPKPAPTDASATKEVFQALVTLVDLSENFVPQSSIDAFNAIALADLIENNIRVACTQFAVAPAPASAASQASPPFFSTQPNKE